MSSRAWQGFLVLVTLAIASCAGKQLSLPLLSPSPTHITGTLEAVADLNPDPNGRPSPLVVRLYELKGPSTFNSADFFSLYEQADTVLGTDLLGRDNMIIKPGETRPLERTLEPETRYVGLLAAYRDLDRALWRTIVEVPPHKTTHLDIELGRTTISARVR